jgi:Lrp/AsnC family leucine-responsive transcriptional regulator
MSIGLNVLILQPDSTENIHLLHENIDLSTSRLYNRKVACYRRFMMPETAAQERLLDEIGWKILAALQENARLSFAEVGRRVGLSTPAVAQRVRRMEDEGIIRAYRAEIDPARVGLPIMAFIRMSVVGNVLAKLTAQVHEMPEIVECHRSTGEDSFILKVYVVTVEQLKDVIDKLTPYGTTSTSLVLSSIKVNKAITPNSAAD